MEKTSDIIVIGGGIIGCSIAFRLAQAGMRVTVLEKDIPGKQASHAAAGMLAVQAETAHGTPDVLISLFEASHALYPDYVAELEDITGIHIGYRRSGSLMVASDYQEAKVLAGLLSQQTAANKPVTELSHQELRELEPHLSDKLQCALLFADDHYVDNRQLLQALITAASRYHVTFLNNTGVTGLQKHGAHYTVETPGGRFSADNIILSAGCWSGSLSGLTGIRLPVRPMRGQILRLQKTPQQMKHLIFTPQCYLVPWPDGRVLVGATMENVGFNNLVTAAGVAYLLAAALQTAPGLSDAGLTHLWAGLRPDTEDGLPIIGQIADTNILTATGHFRNGILLAPVTAKILTELIVSKTTTFPIEAYSPNRFHQN